MNIDKQNTSSSEWAESIKKYLMERKKIHALSYPQISARLAVLGTIQSPENLSRKFNRGSLSAQLFVTTLVAMEDESINLKKLQSIYEKITSR